MLHRALKGVGQGFYVDVGANDPVIDSVTKAFYDAGWRGINIEPVSEWFEKLALGRPEDINLQVAAGVRKSSALPLYEVLGTGLSTMDKSIAEKHAEEHGFEFKQDKVSVVSLTSICEQYAHSDIHFLKIDVEGSEQLVLQGLDLKKIRPWIILVESTQPLTQIENYDEWERILLLSDYEYCYFDGLNRFYVAKEHDELKNALNVPPNVFDEFISTHLVRLQTELTNSANQKQALEAALQQAEQQHQELTSQLQSKQAEATQYQERLQKEEQSIQSLTGELEASKQQVDELHQSNHYWRLESARLNKELDAVYHSKSWIVTWPLRKLSRFTQWFFYPLIKLLLWFIHLPKRPTRWLLVKAMAYVLKRPELKARSMAWLQDHQKLEGKLRQLALARGFAVTDPVPEVINLEPILSSLTPSARRIYKELTIAIEHHHKEKH